MDNTIHGPMTATEATRRSDYYDADTLLRQHCLELAIKRAENTPAVLNHNRGAVKLAQKYFDFIKGAGKLSDLDPQKRAEVLKEKFGIDITARPDPVMRARNR